MIVPKPGELPPWPYGRLPSAMDYDHRGRRFIIQATEDGYYGFAFYDGVEIASMVGPDKTTGLCGARLVVRTA